MIWEKDGSSLEIRTQGQLADGRPALDEIVARGAFVHLEQMAHDHWWMGLEAARPGESGEEGRSKAEGEEDGTEAQFPARRCRDAEDRQRDTRHPSSSRCGTDTGHGVVPIFPFLPAEPS
jgi:hypothetical protein